MKTLNLVYPDKSEIKYKVQKFPDGQQNIVIEGFIVEHSETRTDDGKDELHKIGTTIFDLHFGKVVTIKSRLNNFLDLELIICAVKALRNLGVKEIHLFTGYILGGRSDRLFEEGSTSYIKQILAPILNSLNFESITCIDPHSDVLEACLDNFKKISNKQLVNWATREIGPDNIWISPDAGASKKIFKLAEQIGYKGDIITCSKDRDNEGKLTKVNVPITFTQLKSEKDIIIIDDICDGGATFINIGKEIREQRKSSKIYLIVTHSIFSKGFIELSDYFDGIYCTNSYSDLEFDPNRSSFVRDKVKQLNIF